MESGAYPKLPPGLGCIQLVAVIVPTDHCIFASTDVHLGLESGWITSSRSADARSIVAPHLIDRKAFLEDALGVFSDVLGEPLIESSNASSIGWVISMTRFKRSVSDLSNAEGSKGTLRYSFG